MAKTKTSSKHKEYSKNTEKKFKYSKEVKEFNAMERLLDKNFIGKAVLECLENDDPEGVMEILNIYLDTVDRAEALKKSNIANSTYYYSKKHKNPTIRTLAKMVHASTLLRK